MFFSSWLRKHNAKPRTSRRATSRFRPQLEVLEGRALPSTYTAGTASDLIADISAANKAGGANTIVLTAPTSSPYVLTAVNNSTDGPTGLPVISKKDTPSGTQFYMGSPAGDSYRQLDGLTDEAAIYNRALSPTEIQSIYNAGSAGKHETITGSTSVSVGTATASP
jgi:hypothetical protein